MDDGKLEWGSDNLDTIFAQRKNLASPAFLQMLRDVIRFGKEAPKVPLGLSSEVSHLDSRRCPAHPHALRGCTCVWPPHGCDGSRPVFLRQVLEPSVSHIYGDMTLGEYLRKHSYSTSFTNNYVVPMCAAVWSVPNAQVGPDAPAG